MILRECNFANSRRRQISRIQTLVDLQENARPSQIDILKVSSNNQEVNCFSKKLNRYRYFREDKSLFIIFNKRQQSIMIFLKLPISELFVKFFIINLVFLNQSVYVPNNSIVIEEFHRRHFQRKAAFQIYFVLTLLNKKDFSGCVNLYFSIAK